MDKLASTRDNFMRSLGRFNDEFHRLGAVLTLPDGVKVIDPLKAPASMLDAYNRLQQYGYANGLFDTTDQGES